MPRLLYVVNIPRFFVSHRLPLALAARDTGYDVHVVTGTDDANEVAKIDASGLPFHALPLTQHGTNPLNEVRTIARLMSLYRSLQPDLVHHVSIKPVLYGGMASRFTSVKAVVSAMSGLGYVFIGDDQKRRLIRAGVLPLMRFALAGSNTRMIFQNPDDQARFTSLGMIPIEKTVLVKGSGVDTDVYVPVPEREGLPVVLFAGRLMWQKGLGIFVEAAQSLKGKARFVVAGYAEKTSPDTVPVEQLQAWADEGLIEWWGKRDDMPNVFAQSHIVTLPSIYGEGVPKVLIEAASCGRAIITTDTPGCREIVAHQHNGLLVVPNDSAAFTQAIASLLDNPDERARLGANGREKVLAEFSMERVNTAILALYRTLLTPSA